MRKEDIKKLKELATNAVKAMPGEFTVNGNGDFFNTSGSPVDPIELMQHLDKTREALDELHLMVMDIKEKKSTSRD